MMSLADTRVLVAGATGGLGTELTRMLADRGARLTLVSRSEPRLAALGIPDAALIALDLGASGAGQLAVEAAVSALGGLDGVVFIAGVVAFGPVAELEESTFRELLNSNLVAPVQLLRAAGQYLIRTAAEGGSPFVLNVSAVAAEQPMAGMAAYAASKAALTAFDAAAAREFRRARVRLIDARPPHTETGLAGRPIAGTAPTLPHGKRPEDVAARLIRAIETGERDLPSSAFE